MLLCRMRLFRYIIPLKAPALQTHAHISSPASPNAENGVRRTSLVAYTSPYSPKVEYQEYRLRKLHRHTFVMVYAPSVSSSPTALLSLAPLFFPPSKSVRIAAQDPPQSYYLADCSTHSATEGAFNKLYFFQLNVLETLLPCSAQSFTRRRSVRFISLESYTQSHPQPACRSFLLFCPVQPPTSIDSRWLPRSCPQ